jgi:hypothetical protein
MSGIIESTLQEHRSTIAKIIGKPLFLQKDDYNNNIFIP